MAHEFDTGFAKPLRTRVTEAVLTALDRLRYRATPTPSGYVRALVSFGSQVRGPNDDVGIDALFEVLGSRQPAIAVGTGTKSYNPAGVGGFRWMGQLEVELYFLSLSPRSLEARQLGGVEMSLPIVSDIVDPGLWVMMEHAEQLLIGQTLGLGPHVKDMRPQREEELASTDELTLWRQVYHVDVTRTIDEKRDVTLELQRIVTTHKAKLTDDDTAEVIITTDRTL